MTAHHAGRAFWSLYEKLPASVQQLAKKQFALLKSDAGHPSLHFKKIRTRNGREVWSVRISEGYRALAISVADGFLWFWIGDHGAYDKLIY